MPIISVIALVVLIAYGVLINYYFACWLSIPTSATKTGSSLKVTVVVPARNEENNIVRCLQSLSQQTHPVQVIVVNDHSTDRTAELVADFPAPNILLINLRDHLSGVINSYKKQAIELAIKHATGEIIVCTDADCTAGPKWIESLVDTFEKKEAIFVAAPVRMTNNGSLLGIFQTLDFLPLQGITGAAVHRGIHAMSNGANLAYSKMAFYEVNGFQGINQIASGDDMLLMQKIAKQYHGKIAYVKHEEAIVSTAAEPTISLFLNQRIRWACKAGHYKQPSISIALSIVYLANLLTLAVLLVSFKAFMLMTVLKIMLEFLFVTSVAKFYGQQKLMLYFPFIQPLHMLYTVVAGALGVFGTYQWKSRRVR